MGEGLVKKEGAEEGGEEAAAAGRRKRREKDENLLVDVVDGGEKLTCWVMKSRAAPLEAPFQCPANSNFHVTTKPHVRMSTSGQTQ